MMNIPYRRLTITDADYPALLRLYTRYQDHQCPSEIYVRGNVDLLKRPACAIIGTREPSAYGDTCAMRISQYLSDHGCAIVSGGAKGIDASAHVASYANTIVILNSPLLDMYKLYPKENQPIFEKVLRDGGLILSQYVNEDYRREVLIKRLIHRSYLQAAFSGVVIPIQAGDKSGTRHAVEHGHALMRPIYTIEGNREDRFHHPKPYIGIDEWVKAGWATRINPDDEQDLKGVLQTVLDMDWALRRKAKPLIDKVEQYSKSKR